MVGTRTSSRRGRLNNGLKQLDALVASLRDNLGVEWANIMVMVATHFELDPALTRKTIFPDFSRA
jgi:uncharacterized protein (DUF1501 family)